MVGGIAAFPAVMLGCRAFSVRTPFTRSGAVLGLREGGPLGMRVSGAAPRAQPVGGLGCYHLLSQLHLKQEGPRQLSAQSRDITNSKTGVAEVPITRCVDK